MVAGSNYGSLFLKSDGSLWGAGPRLGGEDPYRDLGPRQLDAGPVTPLFNRWVSLRNYALWTRPDGSLWAVGISYYGRFGNGNANQYTFNDPQQLLSTGVSAVAAGRYHSLIVKSDGSLWSAGNNEYGQLGNGTTEDHDIWVKVVDANATKVYASSHSSMFLKK